MSCKKILFATLNWGLGHATRCIPIIHHLLKEGHQVFIASDGAAGLLLREEFPELPYLSLPSYFIRYPEKNIYMFWIKEALRLKKVIAKDLSGVSNHLKDLSDVYQRFWNSIVNDQRSCSMKTCLMMYIKVCTPSVKRFDVVGVGL
jgi:UDP:flavonoid glycosyltransferase YjiC (YdhE family)